MVLGKEIYDYFWKNMGVSMYDNKFAIWWWDLTGNENNDSKASIYSINSDGSLSSPELTVDWGHNTQYIRCPILVNDSRLYLPQSQEWLSQDLIVHDYIDNLGHHQL